MSYKNVVKVVRELTKKVDKIDRDIKEIKDKVLNNNKNNKPVSDSPTKGTWDEAYKVEKKYPTVKKVINRDW